MLRLPPSEIDLGADLDDLIRRQLEVTRCGARVAGEEREEALFDLAHLAARSREHRLAAEEIRDVVDVDVETARARLLEERGNVGSLHEAVFADDAMKAAAQRLERRAFAGCDVRDLGGDDGEEDDRLVEHVKAV